MDSYSQGLRLDDKDYVPDVGDNELCCLSEVRGESQPEFDVDEVQLRFDLGSLVDAQVLLDTHGPRENHWDFMRQEQGRFQTSMAENTSLKQEDLKPFDNCEGWPRSVSQVDTQLFADAQDDVSMITEVFGEKEKTLGDLIEDDRGLMLPAYKHREEASPWIAQSRQDLEGEAEGERVDTSFKEDSAYEAMEVSQVSVERPFESQTKKKNETKETEESVAGLGSDPLLDNEQSIEGNPALLLETLSVCHKLSNASEETQEENRAHSGKPVSLSINAVEMSEQAGIELDKVIENKTKQVGLPIGAQVLDEELNITTVEMREDETPTAKFGVKLQSELPDPLKKDDGSGEPFINLTQEIEETVAEPSIHSHTMLGCASPVSEQQSLDVAPNAVAKQSIPGVDQEERSNMPETGSKEDKQGLQDPDGVVFGTTVRPCEEVGKIDEYQGITGEDLGEQGQATHEATHVEQGDIKEGGEKELAVADLLASEDQILCSTASAGARNEVTVTDPVMHSHEMPGSSSPSSEQVRLDVTPDAVTIQSAPSVVKEEVTNMPEMGNKQKTPGLCHSEDADRMVICTEVRSSVEVGKIDEAQERTGKGLDEQGGETQKATSVEQVNTYVAGQKGLAVKELFVSEEQMPCPKPSACLSKQNPVDVYIGTGDLENTSMCADMKQEEGMHDLSTTTLHMGLKETINQDCMDTSKWSTRSDDDLESNRKDNAGKDIANLVQTDIVNLVQMNGINGKDIENLGDRDVSVGNVELNTQLEAQCGGESSRQGIVLDEKHCEHYGIGDDTRSSVKPNPLVQGEISMDASQLGGGLHIVLDVQQEGASGDFVPQSGSEQGQLKINEGFSDTNVSGLTALAAISGFQKDEQIVSTTTPNVTPTQDKVSKRTSDASMRNNRLKDSARASPLLERADQKQKSIGRRKMTPKVGAQKIGVLTSEDYSSPNKTGSKSVSGQKKKKGTSSSVPQEAAISVGAQDGLQTLSNTGKNSFSVNARQHASTDLNVPEMAVAKVLPAQPFSESQQVQLRAQILVYGSLIQGSAPEEALMVAAFSNVTGGHETGQEASGRAVWEKQWQAAVERIHAKSSTLRDPTRASGGLVSNLPIMSAKASEETPGVHARVSEISNTKSYSKQGADLGAGHSVRSNQSAAVALAPVLAPAPSISTVIRSVPASTSESSFHSTKPCVDVPQITPRAYYPAPPLGAFMTGAPQWLSPPSWISQTQAAVHNAPSTLFTHGHAVVGSDQTPEKAAAKRSTPPSSGQVVPGSSTVSSFFTGPQSLMPTTTSESLQVRQPTSESRPRKRKKTQSESYAPPVENPLYNGLQVTSVSALPTSSEQAGLTILSSVNLPSFMVPESLAMVVTNAEIPKMVSETSIVPLHADKISAPSSTNMHKPSASILATEQRLERAKNSTSHLEQAQASAEEAASVAASAVEESEAFWSQLKAQKSGGLTLDTEMQLVSSAVAIATAASVAKAAAAAARVAYEAAVEAKMISEDSMESSKQDNTYESSRLLQGKADSDALQTWQMPESCNSIMAAAKMASKKRLEATSAARVRAQNLESIVRAAELTSSAVTQIGSVMAMGESVPFTLEMLMEAGPEGFYRVLSMGLLEDKGKEKKKATGVQTAGKKGTPKQTVLEEKGKRSLKKVVSGTNEASPQKEAQTVQWPSDNAILAQPDNAKGFNADLGVELMTELSKQKSTDLLPVSIQTSRQGILTAISLESGLAMQEPPPASDNQIVKDSMVEVMSNEKGLRGVWFSARVQNVEGGKVLVLYDDLLADDGFSPLEEWIDSKGSPSKAPRVRLAHPNTNIGFEGTRKRRREAMGSHKWSVGDRVDAWMRDGWWEGEIKEINENGQSKAKVFFPGDGDTSLVKTTKLRPSLVWDNGHWILWTDAKQGKIELHKVANEADTPVAKRQKTDKVEASAGSKQKLVGMTPIDMTSTHKEGSLFDDVAGKDIKSFALDGEDKFKQQGSKVVFGVPRPTKKRKLTEVSKHFNPARGANTLNVKATSKHTDANTTVGFVTGPAETSKLDGSKTKKKVLSSQKARPVKGVDVQTGQAKVSAIRNKKERPVSDAKILVRKDSSTREAPLSVSKNSEKKLIKKKMPSHGSQPASQAQHEDPPLGDASVQKVAAFTNTPILEELTENSTPMEGGKVPSHTAPKNEKYGKGSEKEGTHSGKHIGREPAGEASGDKQPPSKDNEKQSAQQEKESDKLPTESKQNSQSLKSKEALAKDNEQPGLISKESESQPAKEKQFACLEKPKEKQGSSSVEKQGKDVRKPVAETWEPRRTSRKIQPTSKLLEGLQTAPKVGKNSSSHDKGGKLASKVPSQP